ncbi:MAG: winged helix-turn-helix domain-containing protein [Clostridia bacterium]|nr:winged helix-turn-helix domain-containing protein [Clostridia bacterium]
MTNCFGYFELLSKKYGKSFTLPCSITELANYLAVDRSSMTRELSYLKSEKFILQNRDKITLLY